MLSPTACRPNRSAAAQKHAQACALPRMGYKKYGAVKASAKNSRKR
jgi:hypothetical protein